MLAFHHIFEVVRKNEKIIIWSWVDSGGQRVDQFIDRGSRRKNM